MKVGLPNIRLVYFMCVHIDSCIFWPRPFYPPPLPLKKARSKFNLPGPRQWHMLDAKNVTVRASVHADLSAKNQHIGQIFKSRISHFLYNHPKNFLRFHTFKGVQIDSEKKFRFPWIFFADLFFLILINLNTFLNGCKEYFGKLIYKKKSGQHVDL